jgi:cephalosporin hydroxylase
MRRLPSSTPRKPYCTGRASLKGLPGDGSYARDAGVAGCGALDHDARLDDADMLTPYGVCDVVFVSTWGEAMNLWADFLNNQGRQIHKWTHYFPIYERHLNPLVNRTVTFIEIGVSKGGSLQLWKRYLGPFARIIGLDIDPACKAVEEEQISVRIGDQSDAQFLQSVFEEFGLPDAVVDDGSHIMSHIASSFEFFYPRMDKNGVYLVEDLHTAYWDEYGGGLRRPESFIERSKSLIDDLNADHTRGAVPASAFSKTTHSMHFYDSVVVFERGQHIRKYAPTTGESGGAWTNWVPLRK